MKIGRFGFGFVVGRDLDCTMAISIMNIASKRLYVLGVSVGFPVWWLPTYLYAEKDSEKVHMRKQTLGWLLVCIRVWTAQA